MDASVSNLPVTKLSLYPFLPQAASYVEHLNLDIHEIATSPIFTNIIQESVTEIAGAIRGELRREQRETAEEAELQLLAYPLTRILLSCINKPHLTHRYAVAEAKAASINLKKETDTCIKRIAEALGMHLEMDEDRFFIRLPDYVQVSHGIRELKWKLVNQRMHRGRITLKKKQVIRLLEEKIKKRVLHNMPLEVSPEICRYLQHYTQEINTLLSTTQHQASTINTEGVNKSHFPPCITHILKNLQAGVNLSHSARFALTSFLLSIGMSTDEITELFNVSPDFDVEKTRYQIQHIAGAGGTTYTPPSCATMNSFGNCIGKDRLCGNISHPLGYYRKKAWLERRRKTKKQQLNTQGRESFKSD